VARDYKPRTKGPRKPPPQREQRSLPGWIWMGAGFGLGLAAAYGVHAYHTGGLPSAAVAGLAPSVAGPREPRPRPPHPTREASRTRFEFYSLLPEMEVVVPETEVAGRPAPTAAGPPGTAAAEPPARYVLQAGAFRSLADADRLRATLALSGLEATIQTVAVDGHATWHRVRLGPYSDLGALQAARARLRQANIEAMILKIKT
jgi:cell division protein FtsN